MSPHHIINILYIFFFRRLLCCWIFWPNAYGRIGKHFDRINLRNFVLILLYISPSHISYPSLTFLPPNHSSLQPSLHPPLYTSLPSHTINNSTYLNSIQLRSPHLTSPHLIVSQLILSYLILSYLILSYHILSYIILSYLILSYLILSYLILSYLI